MSSKWAQQTLEICQSWQFFLQRLKSLKREGEVMKWKIVIAAESSDRLDDNLDSTFII